MPSESSTLFDGTFRGERQPSALPVVYTFGEKTTLLYLILAWTVGVGVLALLAGRQQGWLTALAVIGMFIVPMWVMFAWGRSSTMDLRLDDQAISQLARGKTRSMMAWSTLGFVRVFPSSRRGGNPLMAVHLYPRSAPPDATSRGAMAFMLEMEAREQFLVDFNAQLKRYGVRVEDGRTTPPTTTSHL